MLNIKHTLMVSTLSLGLVMGGVAVVSATTSATGSNTSQTTPTHVTTARITPEPVITPEAVTPVPVTSEAVTPVVVTPVVVTPAPVTPVQHQITNVTHPTENHNTNMGEHHSESGHE